MLALVSAVDDGLVTGITGLPAGENRHFLSSNLLIFDDVLALSDNKFEHLASHDGPLGHYNPSNLIIFYLLVIPASLPFYHQCPATGH
jgi:hypothetical protein